MKEIQLELTISQMARKCGVGIETIRFYHRQGLLSIPGKVGKIRKYGAKEFLEFQFIKNAKACGLSLVEIKRLIQYKADGAPGHCKDVQVLIDRKFLEITREIEKLKDLSQNLCRVRTECDLCRKSACRLLGELSRAS